MFWRLWVLGWVPLVVAFWRRFAVGFKCGLAYSAHSAQGTCAPWWR